jgi:maleate isomerase
MWQPDGAGIKAKIGVLTPHLDPVPESESMALAPQGVSMHAARVPLGMVGPDGEIIPMVGPDIAKAFSETPEIDLAVSSLAPLNLNAIIYSFTSSSYILGSDNDAALRSRVEERSNGGPVITQSMAVVQALKALN